MMQKELTRSRSGASAVDAERSEPGANAAEVFTIRNLCKAFGDEQPYLVLDGIDLSIRSSEFLCLLGASGCGKSTLLNLLAGFDKPTSGELLYRGRSVAGPGKERVVFFQIRVRHCCRGRQCSRMSNSGCVYRAFRTRTGSSGPRNVWRWWD